jgi:hypothetical protein
MDSIQESIIKYSEEILDYLLQFKEVNTDFTFSLRERDFSKAGGPKRLETGQWFQGSDYIYVPLFKKGDNARKIKTIGFSIDFDKLGNIKKNFIEISFKAGIVNENEISFHRQLASKIGLELNENNHGEKLFENPQNIISNLNFFITEFRNHALTLLNELGLSEEYVISEADFQKNLNRIQDIKLGINTSLNYTFNELTLDFENFLNTNNQIYHDLKVGKKGKQYFWISDRAKIIGDIIAHYEIILRKGILKVEVHFEGTQKQKDIFHKSLNSLPSKTSFFDWNKSKSITFIEDFELKTPDLVLKLANALKYIDEALGNRLRTIKNSIIIDNNKMKTIINIPLNQILYGPPGTGKTYNTVLEAAKIVTGNEAISYDDALKIFNDNLGNQIEFITFHQNYSYEDFIQGIRPDTENGKELTFEKQDGVFKRIADIALDNLKLSEKAPNELSNEALFDKALDDFKESILESEDKYQINETAYIYEVEKEAFRYTGEKWGYINGLRMKFVDLKEFYRNNVKSRKDVKSLTSISGLANQHATYYYLVYEQILKHLPKEIENPVKVEHKNFVIIIDEINRANISRVFGELITLIEDDKRSHGAIPMRVTLPSGDPFIVPSNLYIIGTMNTADKSIALLDIALRRRFDFVPMYPLYEGLEKPIHDVEKLQKINDAILSRKNHDFTIGHAYFMGIDYTLEKTINKKVIPLLLEYFMNDEKEVTSILQAAGIKIGGWPLKMI